MAEVELAYTMDELLLITKSTSANADVQVLDEFELGYDIDELLQKELVFRRILGVWLTAGLLDTFISSVGYGIEITSRPRPYRTRTTASFRTVGPEGRFS